MNVKRSLRQPSAGEGEAHVPRATLGFRGCSVPSVMQKTSPRGALLASHQLICYAELTMTQEQRRLFAEKLMDTANIAVGALVFGQRRRE
jgi:hypothetical protein